MSKTARLTPSDTASMADWDAVLRGDRAAFRAIVAPHLGELLEAARRELRYHIALGDFSPDDLTAEELVGEVLARAWRERQSRPPGLDIRAWLLAVLFRVAEDLARCEGRRKEIAMEAPEEVPPGFSYDDEDESFWEWYQPEEITSCGNGVDQPSTTPEEATAAEEFARSLSPSDRKEFLMHELHGVRAPHVALALGLPAQDTSRRLADLHRTGRGVTGKTS